MEESIDDDLFVGLGPEAIRAHAKNSESIDVNKKKEEMKEVW
jgi:hypothetical protein